MIKEFITDRKLSGLSPRTIEYYDENLARYQKFCEKNEYKLLNKDSYDSYCLYLLDKDIRRATVHTYLRAVRTFLRWCTDNGYCDFGYKVKLPKKPKDMKVPLSDNEIFLIMRCLSDGSVLELRNKCIVLLMLDCGLRRGEVVSLEKQNVNFADSSLSVVGKGEKRRFVPIGGKVLQCMMYYDNLVERVDDKMFFVNKSGYAITGNTIRCFFQDLKKQTGIERLHPHLLRHTFATRYLLNGGNLEALRLLLGHADLEITQVYLHLSEYMKILQGQHISLIDRLGV